MLNFLIRISLFSEKSCLFTSFVSHLYSVNFQQKILHFFWYIFLSITLSVVNMHDAD